MIKNINNVGVWLINLPRDVERLERMDKQLKSIGIDYFLFRAIDGQLESERFEACVDTEAYRRNMGRALLPGQVGVYASHLAVWKELCASSFDVGLIFEDDVIFHDDFMKALCTALSVSSHWDLIRFSCVRAKIPISQGKFGCYHLNAYIGPFTGNASYLIHKRVAARIITRLQPMTRALDHELNRFDVHDYRLRGLEPFACHTDDGGISTITGKKFSMIEKPRWYKRLPYYATKINNYRSRAYYLLRRR